MKDFFKNIFNCILISAIILTVFSSQIIAYGSAGTVSSFNSADTGIICIAHRGDVSAFPENSVEAVNAAAEYDMVSVDVRLTSDGKAVLMADETTVRMCVDARGNTFSGKVSEMSSDELGRLYLRQAHGGTDQPKTRSRVATLEDALKTAGSAELMLNITIGDFRAVYDTVVACGALNRVVFRFPDSSTDKISALYNSTSKDAVFVGNYQGNIIFLATSAVKKCFESGINVVELGSKNGHGVLYDSFLMKRFKTGGRAMVSMVGGRCGDRPDNEIGWDDLISRGYSVIETDYPAELTDYIKKVEASRSQLERYYDLYSAVDFAPYTTESENTLKKALKSAEETLAVPASLSGLQTAKYDIQKAYSDLTPGSKRQIMHISVSAGRIITAALCAAAFIASQIYLYKKREKKISAGK
ncbi:MAG: glycerophosphodiester phosphodiesterase family protein [Clostridia bacterium]|nr:glycerophosphodiester phosphodiesterase family protein [Clostridia bacterium]